MAEPAAVDTSKDWKAIAERWEKHNQSLQGEIEKMKMDQKNVQQQIDEHKAEIKDMAEKLALEKSWREKEQATIEKFKHHEKDLKTKFTVRKASWKKNIPTVCAWSVNSRSLRSNTIKSSRKKGSCPSRPAASKLHLSPIRELKELKSENTQLKEKRADIQWVAKSEFDELKKVLQAKEQDLARLKESHG